VTHGAAPDIRLGDLRHLDRGHRSRRDAGSLERVLQRQGVDERGQHAHEVAGCAIEASLGRGQAAEDVASADHHRDLHAHLMDALDLRGDVLHHLEIDAVIAASAERFAAQLQQDAVVLRRPVPHRA